MSYKLDDYKKELIKLKNKCGTEIFIAERNGDREYCTFKFKDDFPFFCTFLWQVAPPQCVLFSDEGKRFTNLKGCKITGNILRCNKCLEMFKESSK